MMYLAIILWLVIVFYPIEFRLVFYIFLIRFESVLIPEITDTRTPDKTLISSFVMYFSLLTCYFIVACLDIYYLASHLGNWLLSKTSNKFILLLIVNAFILIGLFWAFKVTFYAKELSKLARKYKDKYYWFKNNPKYRKLIFKVIRQWEINANIKPSHISAIITDMIIENDVVKYSNSTFLLDGKTIKIKDEDGDMKGFESFKQFKSFSLKA